jgi:hypothetical protein
MNSVKHSAVEWVQAAGDRVEGRLVRRGCVAAAFGVASSPRILRTSERGKALAAGCKFDFIYCAGLFDYLPGVTPKATVNLFFEWRRPGGLGRVASVNDSKPFGAAQGCGQWGSSFWTERMGAIHG